MTRIDIETAQSYRAAGLSCLPAVKAMKRPALGSWKKWADRLPTEIEEKAWFSNRHDAICIVAGKVSGNLECLDFDNHGELFAAWMERIDTALLAGLVVEQSPSGGYHVVYRCEKEVEGNLKLARGVRDGRLATLIETRGEGGLFLCAPTEGYTLQQGAFAHVPVISAAAREGLLDAARALDESPAQVSPQPPTAALCGVSGGFLARPGDDFAARGDIRPYLAAAGWQFLGTKPDGNELWRRPGKSEGGHSATYDGHVFYVFSSNAAPFESERGYNGFQVYAMLEHRGDFTAAARSLLDKGYGKADDPLMGVDLSHLKIKLPSAGADGAEQTQPTGVTGQADTLAGQTVQPPPVAAAVPAGPNPLERIGVGRLAREYPKMRPVLIHGFLRLGETMNIIAPPKTGKSWLVTDLAVSVATGTPWFGYPCEQGDVLLIDNELHRETSGSRIPKVIEARGFDPDLLDPHFEIINMRGCLQSIEWIGTHAAEYRERGFKLIIVDAFYRAVPSGTDENDNGAITGLYNLLDRYAAEIGCAIVLIHHTSKGNQSQKSVTDVGAGAGSQSRAADAHVVLRPHKEKGVVVVESVVRSFPATEPFCARFKWPLWDRDETLSTEDLAGKPETRERPSGRDQALDTEEILKHIRELVDTENPLSKSLFVLKISKHCDVTQNRAKNLLEDALALGLLRCERLPNQKDSSQRSTKFVLLGDVDPLAEGDGDEDGDDG